MLSPKSCTFYYSCIASIKFLSHVFYNFIFFFDKKRYKMYKYCEIDFSEVTLLNAVLEACYLQITELQ